MKHSNPSLTRLTSLSTYVPPRAAWTRSPVSPLANSSSNIASSNAIPTQGSYGDLSPVQASPSSPQQAHMPRHTRQTSEPYYEDVDPRFATDEPTIPSALTPGSTHHSPPAIHYTSPPASYTGVGAPSRHHADGYPSAPVLNRNSDIMPSAEGVSNASYEDLPPGVRSPTGSDTSHFTSVSQRPVNPNWRPQHSAAGSNVGGAYPGGFLGPGSTAPTTASGVQRRREDVVLAANPDFSLPGVGSGRGGRGLAQGRGSKLVPVSAGLTPAGRYPTDI